MVAAAMVHLVKAAAVAEEEVAARARVADRISTSSLNELIVKSVK